MYAPKGGCACPIRTMFLTLILRGLILSRQKRKKIVVGIPLRREGKVQGEEKMETPHLKLKKRTYQRFCVRREGVLERSVRRRGR